MMLSRIKISIVVVFRFILKLEINGVPQTVTRARTYSTCSLYSMREARHWTVQADNDDQKYIWH